MLSQEAANFSRARLLAKSRDITKAHAYGDIAHALGLYSVPIRYRSQKRACLVRPDIRRKYPERKRVERESLHTKATGVLCS